MGLKCHYGIVIKVTKPAGIKHLLEIFQSNTNPKRNVEMCPWLSLSELSGLRGYRLHTKQPMLFLLNLSSDGTWPHSDLTQHKPAKM